MPKTRMLCLMIALLGLALVGTGCKKNPTSSSSVDSPDTNQDGVVTDIEILRFLTEPELSFAHIEPGTSEVYLAGRAIFVTNLRAVLSGPSVDEPRAQVVERDANGNFRVIWTIHEFGTYSAIIGTTDGSANTLWNDSIKVQ